MLSVCLNGTLCGNFSAKRGFRQGDPLSPYLFVITMELLAGMLARAVDMGEFKLHLQCKGSKITHLSFADDLIIFTKASVEGVDNELADLVTLASGFRRGVLPFKYLGVPMSAGKLRR
ncbi:Uncharacterized mitochondrial protein AtMg01250, partial [Linum perenne]